MATDYVNHESRKHYPGIEKSYLFEGYARSQKCGSEIMKMKACREFSKIIAEICPELLGYGAMVVEWENEFRKRLEE